MTVPLHNNNRNLIYLSQNQYPLSNIPFAQKYNQNKVIQLKLIKNNKNIFDIFEYGFI